MDLVASTGQLTIQLRPLQVRDSVAAAVHWYGCEAGHGVNEVVYTVVYRAVLDFCVAADFAVGCVVVQRIVQFFTEAGDAQAAETAAEANKINARQRSLVSG